MTPELLCAVTAAARAAAFIGDADTPDRELEPPHPAFVGFRRLAYLWVEPGAWQPVGDRFGIWLDFLRARRVNSVVLDVRSDGAVVWTLHGADADAWRITDTGEQMSLHGEREAFAPPADVALDDAARILRDAIAARIDVTPELQRDELQRALAILESPLDGSEVSDVAWPYFVLPERAYAVEARRLFGAAASAWSSLGDAWTGSASRAVTAAVNSVNAVRAKTSPAGQPVQ